MKTVVDSELKQYIITGKQKGEIGLEHEGDNSWKLTPSRADDGNKWNSTSCSFYFSLM